MTRTEETSLDKQPLKKIGISVNYLKTTFGIALLVIGLAGLLLMTPDNSFASSESNYLKWDLIYISYDSGCAKAAYDGLNQYSVIAKSYMDNAYKIKNLKDTELGFNEDDGTTNYGCYSQFDVKEKYQKSDDLDLLVIVLDRNLGREYLHQNMNIGGLFLSSDSNQDGQYENYIIICDCRDGNNYSEASWALSHEMSHFLLRYLGYDKSISEGLIHSLDKTYDEKCFEGKDTLGNECQKIVYRMDLDEYSYSFKVMMPYKDAIGKQQFFGNNVNDDDVNVELIPLTLRSLLDEKQDYSLDSKKGTIKNNNLDSGVFTIDGNINKNKNNNNLPPEEFLKMQFALGYIDKQEYQELMQMIPAMIDAQNSDKNGNTQDLVNVKSNNSMVISADNKKGKGEIDSDDPESKKILDGTDSLLKQILDSNVIDSHSVDELYNLTFDTRQVGSIIEQLGTTNIRIENDLIGADSEIELLNISTSLGEMDTQDCQGHVFNSGKFYLRCDTELDDAEIKYKIHN